MVRLIYRFSLWGIVLLAGVGLCGAAAGMGVPRAAAAGTLHVTRHIGGVVQAVYPADNYLLWSKGAELEVYTPDGASRLGAILLPALIADVDVADGQAYVAAADGLYVIGLANPAQPVVAQFVPAPVLSEFEVVSAVQAAGGFAYVGLDDGGLWVVDLTTVGAAAEAAAPAVVQAPDHHFVSELYHFGSHLFSVDNSSGTPGKPRVWSLANPAAPAYLGSLSAASDASGLAIVGSTLYLSTFYGGLATYAWNPAQPLNTVPRASLTLSGGAFDLAVTSDGTKAFLAAGTGLVYVDGAGTTAPTVRDAEAAPVGYASRVATRGAHVFAAAGEAALQVYSYDAVGLAFARSRGLRGSLLAGSLQGTELFLAANSQGVHKLNVTNAASPTTTARAAAIDYAHAIAAAGAYVVVGAGSDVAVLRASDLGETGRLPLPGFNQAWDLAALGETVFVAAGHAGVCAIGTANGLPKLHSCFDTAGETLGLSLDGTRLYAADSGNGVVVLNVADPQNMQFLGRYVSSYALAVRVAGSQLYVSDFNNGNGRLLLLNRGSGASLNFAAQFDTRGFVQDIEISGDLVYLANESGLEVLQRPSPTSLAAWAWYDSAGGALDVVLNGSQAYLMDGVNGMVLLTLDAPAPTATVTSPPPTPLPGPGSHRLYLPVVVR